MILGFFEANLAALLFPVIPYDIAAAEGRGGPFLAYRVGDFGGFQLSQPRQLASGSSGPQANPAGGWGNCQCLGSK